MKGLCVNIEPYGKPLVNLKAGVGCYELLLIRNSKIEIDVDPLANNVIKRTFGTTSKFWFN